MLQLKVSELKKWEYLNPNKIQSGTITWNRNGNKTGSISITVITSKKNPFVEFSYTYNDNSRNYKVKLISVPSNLGKGIIWYFLCPKTNKRCRILYSISGYFYHR